MKDLFKIILLTAACTLLMPCFSIAGPLYVVVGTFSAEAGARRFTQSFEGIFEEASFRLDDEKKLYHVHLMETSHQGDAESFRNRLRDEFGFRDAWIYTP